MPNVLALHFDVLGEKQVVRGFNRLYEGISDFSTLWPDIRDDFYRIEGEQFGSAGGHGSGGWAPLSPRYAAYKARHYPGAPILVRTGALRDALTGGSGGHYLSSPDLMEVGGGPGYGQYHQTGTPKMPRRRPIELSEGDKLSFHKLTHQWLIDNERMAVG